MIIETEKGKYELVIGIEIHAQLNVHAKLFSKTRAASGDEPNSDVSFFDIANPGKMPILNEMAVEKAVKFGLAVDAEINKASIFDRKHYFYPDLPAGYQITQFYEPIVKNGALEIELENGDFKKIQIARAHLEQDAGKLMHDVIPGKTAVDLNRSGVPLLEIVSEAQIKSPHEACEYIKNLRAILRAVGSCNGDMEKGEMRCDINISVMPLGSKVFGTRCEVKNVNSIKFVAKAIEYEALRQVKEIEEGRPIICETRLFDANLGVTKSMRGKETAADYRYMPEPDLKPITLTDEFILGLKKEIPELPLQKLGRYTKELGLTKHEALLLSSEIEISTYFESLLKHVNDPKLCANWMVGELFARLNESGLLIIECKVGAENLAQLLNSVKKGEISGKQAKEVLEEMFESGAKAEAIIKEKGFVQVSDPTLILKIIEEVLSNNSEKVAEYKAGRVKLFGFFTGEVMKLSKGSVNPGLASTLLKEKLDK